MSNLHCWNCGTALTDLPLPVSRHATCAACFNELHCCRQCRFYHPDERASQACEEERAEPPLHKSTANFCEFFSPREGPPGSQRVDIAVSTRAALDALFDAPHATAATDACSDKTSPDLDRVNDTSAATRRKLDDLFN